MSILERFPHINKRIVKGDDSELLMYSLKYEKEFVALNIKIPRGANVNRLENGGVLFRLIDDDDSYWRFSEGAYLTSSITPIKIKNDCKKTVYISRDAFGEFKRSYNTDEFYLTNDLYNSPSMSKFNKFWRITPYDEGYRTSLNGSLSHVKGRQVPIDKNRYSFLNKTYGNGDELIILDINVPENSIHTRVEEGVIFWVTDISGDDKEHYVLSTVPKGPSQPIQNRSFIIYNNHYGNSFHGYNYYTPQERVRYDDNLKVMAFNQFWKKI